jgi:phosphoribosylamine--glycine ligase
MLGTGGTSLAELQIEWTPGSSACVVLASEGYPQNPRTGDVIEGADEAAKLPNVQVFHAGTSPDPEGRLVTAGGRVLGVTAVGSDMTSALATAYAAVDHISWAGMQYRHDIGQ